MLKMRQLVNVNVYVCVCENVCTMGVIVPTAQVT